ncbi:DUF3168 domain-containing protein [Micromonospora sp. NPDC047465]|uniref:DUF3168 domain-containing protein n=1 Tax=Micromonospora sp. NPDC047465 TaxID=3154813 RepID=UPI0033D9253E
MTAPVSRSPLHAVQMALYRRLKDDPALTALATGGVWDEVPEGTPYPYIRIGDHLSTPDNDHGGFGREVTVTIHVWTKARGNSQGQGIAGRIGELLDHRPRDLAVVGHRVVSIRQEFDQAFPDANPELRHHVIRFRIITDQE